MLALAERVERIDTDRVMYAKYREAAVHLMAQMRGQQRADMYDETSLRIMQAEAGRALRR